MPAKFLLLFLVLVSGPFSSSAPLAASCCQHSCECACEPCCYPDDAQAYFASAYIPPLRPQVVVGALAVITVISLILINNQGSHHHD